MRMAVIHGNFYLLPITQLIRLATPNITDLIQLNFIVSKNGTARTFRNFHSKYTHIKDEEQLEVTGNRKVFQRKTETLKRNPTLAPHTTASILIIFSSSVHKLMCVKERFKQNSVLASHPSHNRSLSTGYCTCNPTPQILSFLQTGPLLDVSVLPEAETY